MYEVRGSGLKTIRRYRAEAGGLGCSSQSQAKGRQTGAVRPPALLHISGQRRMARWASQETALAPARHGCARTGPGPCGLLGSISVKSGLWTSRRRGGRDNRQRPGQAVGCKLAPPSGIGKTSIQDTSTPCVMTRAERYRSIRSPAKTSQCPDRATVCNLTTRYPVRIIFHRTHVWIRQSHDLQLYPRTARADRAARWPTTGPECHPAGARTSRANGARSECRAAEWAKWILRTGEEEKPERRRSLLFFLRFAPMGRIGEENGVLSSSPFSPFLLFRRIAV